MTGHERTTTMNDHPGYPDRFDWIVFVCIMTAWAGAMVAGVVIGIVQLIAGIA